MHFDFFNWSVISPWFFYQPFQPTWTASRYIPSIGRAGVASCSFVLSRYQTSPSVLETSAIAFARMAFSGSSNVPLQIYWNVSSLLGLFPCNLLPSLIGKQLGNVGQIEYWINKVCKCLLVNSNRSHRIWFCIQERDSLLTSLRLSMEDFCVTDKDCSEYHINLWPLDITVFF